MTDLPDRVAGDDPRGKGVRLDGSQEEEGEKGDEEGSS